MSYQPINVKLTTDQGGGVTALHSTNSITFNFTLSIPYHNSDTPPYSPVSSPINFIKGAFDLKRGNNSSNGITATLYNGLNAS
jgi:hypothetical protein